MELTKRQQDNIVKRYTRRYKKYGYNPLGLGWGKGRRQYIRFHILTAIENLRDKSILDVGCGFGDLYKFLKQKGWNGRYVGVDITPALIGCGKRHFPNVDLRLLNFCSEEISEEFDYVIASGIFNEKVIEDHKKYIFFMLKKMFNIAKEGVAVDFMSSYVDFKKGIAYHAKPDEIFRMAKKLSKRVVLRHDYMPYEFAIYIYKNDYINKRKNIFKGFVQNAQ